MKEMAVSLVVIYIHIGLYWFKKKLNCWKEGIPNGIVANMLDCDIRVIELEF